MTDIIVALIVGGLSLIGVIITNISSKKKVQTDMKVQAAVTYEKLEELTREVREHNNFARRMPVVEEQIKAINHRIINLEK